MANVDEVAWSASRAKTGTPRLHELHQPYTPSKLISVGKNLSSSVDMYRAASSKEIPTIYGGVIYADNWTERNLRGLYNIKNEPELVLDGPNPYYCGVAQNGVYYSATMLAMPDLGYYMVILYGHSIDDKELVYGCNTEDVTCIGLGGWTLNPIDNQVYGITYNKDATGYQLSRITFGESGSVDTETIVPLKGNFHSCAFDSKGQLYAITKQGEFDDAGGLIKWTGSTLCKIDMKSGELTEIGETGLIPHYQSGMTIDPKTDRAFCSVTTIDANSYLYELDLSTGLPELIYQFDHNQEVTGMFVPRFADDGAPAICEGVAAVFEEGSLSGRITLKTPSTLYDGSAPKGALTVKVIANHVEVASQSAAYGANIEIPVTLSEAGKYKFKVYAENSVGEGPKILVEKNWVGLDTPSMTAPTLKYENGSMVVNWEPVTTTVNGGFFDADNMTYTVVRPNGDIAAEGLKNTSFSEKFDAPEEVSDFSYGVYAVAGSLKSETKKSNKVTLGRAIPPYSVDFYSAQQEPIGWTSYDADGDGVTWKYKKHTGMIVSKEGEDDGLIPPSGQFEGAIDDWLISPALKLEGGKSYKVTFWLRAESAWVEIKYGTSPTSEGMTMTLFHPTQITSRVNATEFTTRIFPKADGDYFVGVRAMLGTRPQSEWFSIEAPVSPAIPDVAKDVTATPDPSGELKATISFIAPDKTIKGDKLTELSKIDIYRGNKLVKTFDNPTPGGKLSFVDVADAGGQTTYGVVCANSQGVGDKVTASTFVGFSKPLAPAKATVALTDVEGQTKIEWTPVTHDVNGLKYPENALTYDIYVYNSGWTLVEQNVSGTSHTVQMVAGGNQAFVRYQVIASYQQQKGNATETPMIACGTPYEGIQINFKGGRTDGYIFATGRFNGGASSIVDENTVPSQDGDGYSIGITGQAAGDGAMLIMGMVSLKNQVNPSFKLYTFDFAAVNKDNTVADANEITLLVKEPQDDDWTAIYTGAVSDICSHSKDRWGLLCVPLDAYAGKIVQVAIAGIAKNYALTAIDNITVGDVYAHDLKAVEIIAPENVDCGENYNVDVAIQNLGTKDADSYRVEFYADETLVESKELKNLKAGNSRVVRFGAVMSPLAKDGISYQAKIIYASDENESNNQTAVRVVEPNVSPLPTPTQLSAEIDIDNKSVNLSWTEPEMVVLPEQITEDFEEGQSFVADFGGWTFVDVDGKPVGVLNGVNIPNITPGETAGSFWVWDVAAVSARLDAHSGNKFLFAMYCSDNSQCDDWAISPELCGEAQTISFFAKSLMMNRPEKIEVYYSTESLNPKDFILVENSTVMAVGPAWTEFTCELPEGAKYFAIRRYPRPGMILSIDDVTYTPKPESLELLGYNVYRNGEKINTEIVTECVYVDYSLTGGQSYTYAVTAVYKDRGESSGSNETNITTEADPDGIASISSEKVKIGVKDHSIVFLQAENLPLSIAMPNGMVIFSGIGTGKTSVDVVPGIYIVCAGTTVRKVVVK